MLVINGSLLERGLNRPYEVIPEVDSASAGDKQPLLVGSRNKTVAAGSGHGYQSVS